MAELAWHVLRTEGLRGLYKGALPNIAKAAPNSAVTFVVYEFFVGWLSAHTSLGQSNTSSRVSKPEL